MAAKQFTIFDVKTGEIKSVISCPPGHARHQCGAGEHFRPGALDDSKYQVDPNNPFGPPMEKGVSEKEQHEKEVMQRIENIEAAAHTPIAEQIRVLMDYVLETDDPDTLSPAAAALWNEMDLIVSNREWADAEKAKIRKEEGL